MCSGRSMMLILSPNKRNYMFAIFLGINSSPPTGRSLIKRFVRKITWRLSFISGRVKNRNPRKNKPSNNITILWNKIPSKPLEKKKSPSIINKFWFFMIWRPHAGIMKKWNPILSVTWFTRSIRTINTVIRPRKAYALEKKVSRIAIN